jgi:chromate reductase, NAD(P)H dehydrogenase (quinone)
MDSTPFRILGIAGSLRAQSFNRALIRVARDVAPAGVTVYEHDLANIPLYNGDVEAAGVPQPVLDFAEAIRGCDALLIATPEYNYSVPGVLKNALDWASRPSVRNPLRQKPIAIMGASGGQWGTVRAQLALRQILASSIESYVMVKPELMVNNGRSRFDEQGHLVDDDIRDRVAAHVEALVTWSNRLRADVGSRAKE